VFRTRLVLKIRKCVYLPNAVDSA